MCDAMGLVYYFSASLCRYRRTVAVAVDIIRCVDSFFSFSSFIWCLVSGFTEIFYFYSLPYSQVVVVYDFYSRAGEFGPTAYIIINESSPDIIEKRYEIISENEVNVNSTLQYNTQPLRSDTMLRLFGSYSYWRTFGMFCCCCGSKTFETRWIILLYFQHCYAQIIIHNEKSSILHSSHIYNRGSFSVFYFFLFFASMFSFIGWQSSIPLYKRQCYLCFICVNLYIYIRT